MVQTPLLGFQRNPKGLFVPSPGGLPGFQRQGMDQRKKGGAGAAVCTWNPASLDASITLSNGSLDAAGNTAGTFANVQGTVSHTSGKWYLEIKNDLTQAQSGGVPGVGFVTSAFTTATFVENGGGTAFLTYGETRDDTNNTGTYPGTCAAWNTAGDVISLAVDLDNRRVWCRVNGGPWNNGVGGADPATSVGGLGMGTAAGAPGSAIVPAATPFANTARFTLNTGQGAFAYAIPNGFINWG